MRDRAYRRKQKQRLKKRWQDRFKCYFWWEGFKEEDLETIASFRANTSTPCSCWMCGNVRKFFNEKTRQEILNDIAYFEYQQSLTDIQED